MPIHTRKKGCNRHKSRIQKTRKRKRDIDQIQEEATFIGDQVIFDNKDKIITPDDDLPGQGLFPCQACARHFIDQKTLDEHTRSKVHKKRLRELKEPMYTHAEAEAAGGLGNFNPPKKRKKSHMEVESP